MKEQKINLNLNALKLWALASMIVDHVTKILYLSPDSFGTKFGRIAMPLFVLLLVLNLQYNSKNPFKYLKRIFIFAVLSQLPFYLAFHDPLLLNILFTLGFLGLTLHFSLALIKRSAWNYYWIVSIIILLFLGLRLFQVPFYFDYGAPAIIFGLTISSLLVHRTLDFALFTLISCYFLNNSLVSFVAIIAYLPVIFYFCWRAPWKLDFINRYKYFFYAFYPLHLILLVIIHLLIE